jgi:hypothetical protein
VLYKTDTDIFLLLVIVAVDISDTRTSVSLRIPNYFVFLRNILASMGLCVLYIGPICVHCRLYDRFLWFSITNECIEDIPLRI